MHTTLVALCFLYKTAYPPPLIIYANHMLLPCWVSDPFWLDVLKVSTLAYERIPIGHAAKMQHNPLYKHKKVFPSSCRIRCTLLYIVWTSFKEYSDKDTSINILCVTESQLSLVFKWGNPDKKNSISLISINPSGCHFIQFMI